MEVNKSNIVFRRILGIITAIYLILFSINFYSITMVLPIMVFPIILLTMVRKKYTQRYFINVILLQLFCFLFSVMSSVYFNENSFVITQFIIFGPVTMYMLGYHILEFNEKIHQKFIYFSTLVVTALMLFGFLSYLKTMNEFGSMEIARVYNGGQRLLNSFWDNQLLTATGINTYFSLSLSLIPIIFIKLKNNPEIKKYKIVLLVGTLLSIYAVIDIGNRTGLVIILLSLLVSIMYLGKLSNNTNKVITVLLSGLIMSYLLYINDIFNIRTFWEKSYLADRFNTTGVVDQSRFNTWGDVLKNLFTFPMGGRQSEISLNYAHNLWLDVGYDVGIIPLILIVGFTILTLIDLLKLLRNPVPPIIKCMMLCLYTSFYFTFMIEPIMQGWVLYFTLYCFFSGMVRKLNESSKQSKILLDSKENLFLE